MPDANLLREKAAAAALALDLLCRSWLDINKTLAALFQQVIRESWSKGNEGQPKEVTFQSFSVGSPYSYRPVDSLSGGSPDGPGGRMGTNVYPVRATFTVRETYSTELQYSRRTRDFSCFITAQNYWTCNMVGGGYDTQTWRQPF